MPRLCGSLLIVATAISFALSVTIVGNAEEAKKPNFVILLSDDQRWDDYSFMGHPVIKTPHIDQLAKESLVFHRGYVPTSLCRPSLATLFTGLYPHQSGITGNDPQQGKRTVEGRAALVDRFVQNPRIADLLGKHGYRSFQSGKWWEGHYSSGGFTDGMTHGDVKRRGRHGDVGLDIGRKTMQPVFDFVDQCVADEKPFFLWYAPMMPHLPHNPPEEILARYKADDRPLSVAKYYAMCEWWDQTCGQVLGHLEKNKIADNTVVIYLCDNGWTQLPDAGGGAIGGPRGKRSAYDGGTRTPIMIRYPGRVMPGHNRSDLASSIDILPTILEIAEIDRPKSLPGVDLLDAQIVSTRKAIFGEIYSHDIPDYRQPELGLFYRWVILGDWKLIVPTGKQDAGFGPSEVALYIVSKDPNERENVAAENPEVVSRLKKQLDDWWNPSITN